jgi:hypothetical protein
LAGLAAATAISPGIVPRRRAHLSVQFLVAHAEESAAPAADSAVGRFVDLLATLEARERRITQAARAR